MAVLQENKAKVGDIIRIICLKDDDGIPDPAAERYKGLEGEVTSIDGMGNLHGTWGSLGILEEDDYIVIGHK